VLLNEPRSQPPSWLDELRITLLWPDRRWSADGTIDLLAAGRELEGWLYDRRQYDKRHEPGWVSAINDFKHSARQIGPRLKRALRPDLRIALDTADSLRADVQSKNAKFLKTHLPQRLPDDQAVYTAFKGRWSEPAIRLAAWQDFVAACEDETTDYDTLAQRRDLFWQIIRTADYDPERLSNLLAGALTDYELYLNDARRRLGDLTDEQFSMPNPIDTVAGLTEDERLTLCERLITLEPIKAHRIVWLAFDRAGRGTGVQDLGAVAFWEDSLVRETLSANGPKWDGVPSELRATHVKLGPGDLPESQDVIWARVDLGFGAFTDPVRLATEQAESVVGLAGFRAEELRWRLLGGYLDYVDGRLHSRSTFGAPDRLDDMTVPAYTEFMVAELDRLALRLKPHLPITDPDLTEVVQAVRWWQQARTQTPLAALLLDVRALELIASRVGMSWEDYIDNYLRTMWVRLFILGTLKNTVRDALFRSEQLASSDHQHRVDVLRAAIISFVGGSSFTTDIRQCLAALPELVAMFPVHTQLGRRLRTLATHLQSTTSLNGWCNVLIAEWNRLDQRLQRLRNALAHGGPFRDEGIASTYRFGQNLAANSLLVVLEGLLEGKTIASVHAEHVQREAIWWDWAAPRFPDS